MIYNINNSNSNNNKITVVLWYMHMANKPFSVHDQEIYIYISIVTYDTQILTVINRGRYNIISFLEYCIAKYNILVIATPINNLTPPPQAQPPPSPPPLPLM